MKNWWSEWKGVTPNGTQCYDLYTNYVKKTKTSLKLELKWQYEWNKLEIKINLCLATSQYMYMLLGEKKRKSMAELFF